MPNLLSEASAKYSSLTSSDILTTLTNLHLENVLEEEKIISCYIYNA
jgi:hypothetical protein